jgi:hypothetical protein
MPKQACFVVTNRCKVCQKQASFIATNLGYKVCGETGVLYSQKPANKGYAENSHAYFIATNRAWFRYAKNKLTL